MLDSMSSSFRSKNTVTGEKRGRFSGENPEVVATDVLQTPPKKRSKQRKSDKRQEGEFSTFGVIGSWIRRGMSLNWANRYNADRYNAWHYVVGKKKQRGKTVITLDDNENDGKHLTGIQSKRGHPEVVVIDDMPSQEQTVVLTKEVIVLDSPKNPLHEVISGRESPSSFKSTPLRPPDEFYQGYKPILSLSQDSQRTRNRHEILRHAKMKENISRVPVYHSQKPPVLDSKLSNAQSSFTVGTHTPSMGKIRVRQTKETLRKPFFSRKHRSTASEVVRLQEKERYLQLLSQFTKSSLLDDRQSREIQFIIKHDLTEDIKVSSKPPITQRTFVRQSDEILLSPRSSLLPSPVSPIRYPTVLKVQPSLERIHLPNQHIKDLQSIYSNNCSPSSTFDSENSTNIIPPKPRPLKQESLLDGEWTKKWKSILSEDNLSRERQNAKIQREEKRLEDLKAKRKEEQLAAVEEVKARLLHEEEEESEEEEYEEEFALLTDEMEREIDSALAPGNPSETLADGGKVSVTRSDMVTLSNLNWLNDEVINFYFNLITERSKSTGYAKVHSFNSFFYPKLIKTGYDSLKRWTRRVDVFTFDLILVPIHLGMHWCLAAIDFRNKTIKYYDSLKGSNPQCLEALKKYLSQESMDKKKTPYDTSNWTLSCPKDIPEQLNGCDCGVFACKYAEYISRDAKFTFDQRNMPYFRRRIVYEILKMKLL